MKTLITFCYIILACITIQAQGYKTINLFDEIYSIQVLKNGENIDYPILDLSGRDYIAVSFDRISDNSSDRLRYRLLYCDADWTKNQQLNEMDYKEGFSDYPIDNYRHSINTTIEYTHFDLKIPNRDVKPILSGNYVVEIYEESSEKIVLHACFSVLNKQLNIGYQIYTNTDIDTNKAHQQIDIDILHPNLRILNSDSELKVYVKQNRDENTSRSLGRPNYIIHNKLSYKHNKALIFEAGNEYRRFETSSDKYNGMHVEQTYYKRPYYYAFIEEDLLRKGKGYQYDEDQNGRFYIRNREGNNDAIEADYFYTNFTLKPSEPLSYPVFLSGDFTYGELSQKYEMDYNAIHGEYNLTLLLKQGLYNYKYTSCRLDKCTNEYVEGNYYQTENEYAVYVYHRPIGQRYDALVGFINFSSKGK